MRPHLTGARAERTIFNVSRGGEGMRKGPRVVGASLGLMVGIALAPAAGAFGGRGGRGGGGMAGRPVVQQPGFNLAFRNNFGFQGFSGYNRSFPGLDSLGPGFFGFPGSRFNGPGSRFNKGFGGNAGFGWWAPWGATTVYYGGGYGWPGSMDYPAYYIPDYPAPAYAVPAMYAPQAGPSVSVMPAPPTAPPAPSVVAFPGGRYELRGDGIASPYQWVWIPNPPTAPPAPPTAPPPVAEAPRGQPADSPPASSTQLYRWTDDQGTVHWTNRTDAVPAKYRNQAKYTPPA